MAEQWVSARYPRQRTEATPLQLVTTGGSGSRACYHAERQQRRLKANFYGCLAQMGGWLFSLTLKSCPEGKTHVSLQV